MLKTVYPLKLHFAGGIIKFIAYIYIHFNQNNDEKSDISAKIEAGKHLHAVHLVTAEQHQWRRRRPIRL